MERPQDHKVVLMERPQDGDGDGNGNVVVNIYDFKSKAWTKHMKFPWNYSNNCTPASWEACCINGGIHWLMQNRVLGFKSSFHIVTFDLAREKLVVAEYDGEMFGYPTSVRLRNLGGYLSLCCTRSFDKEEIRVDTWVMKEYGVKESWLKLVSFERDLKSLALSDCGRRLLVQACCGCCPCRCRLHWYDLDNKSFQCTTTEHHMIVKAWEGSGFYYVGEQSLIRL